MDNWIWILWFGFIGGILVDTVYDVLSGALSFWQRVSLLVVGYALIFAFVYVIIGLFTGNWDILEGAL
jgi:hypothetical protein